VGDEDPGDGAVDCGLEVLGETATAAQPGKGAFDNPSARQKHKGVLGGVGALDDLEGPLTECGHGAAQLVAGITAIGENVAQSGIERSDQGQDIDGAVAVLDIGGMDLQADKVSLRVGDDVALAAFDLLAGVEPSRTAALGGLHGLTVDDAGGRAGLAPSLCASPRPACD
jgi:hypothetical protein